MIYKIEDVKECVDHVYIPETLEHMQDLMKATLLAIKNSDKYTELQLLKTIRERNDELRRLTYDLLLGIEKVGETAAGRRLDIRFAGLKSDRKKPRPQAKNLNKRHPIQ